MLYICNEANKHSACSSCSHSEPHEVAPDDDCRDDDNQCYPDSDAPYEHIIPVRCIKYKKGK